MEKIKNVFVEMINTHLEQAIVNKLDEIVDWIKKKEAFTSDTVILKVPKKILVPGVPRGLRRLPNDQNDLNSEPV